MASPLTCILSSRRDRCVNSLPLSPHYFSQATCFSFGELCVSKWRLHCHTTEARPKLNLPLPFAGEMAQPAGWLGLCFPKQHSIYSVGRIGLHLSQPLGDAHATESCIFSSIPPPQSPSPLSWYTGQSAFLMSLKITSKMSDTVFFKPFRKTIF